jgi:hypothetical protein
LRDAPLIGSCLFHLFSNRLEINLRDTSRARYANLVGRDRVIAGSDCGFGTWVGQAAVDPDVVWAKLAAMAEGARPATRQILGRLRRLSVALDGCRRSQVAGGERSAPSNGESVRTAATRVQHAHGRRQGSTIHRLDALN